MARRWGVICKNCGEGIELEDYTPIGDSTAEWPSPSRRETLECPNCRETHRYQGDDFKLHDAE